MPPLPAPTAARSVQLTASAEVWTRYADAYADSQPSLTRFTDCDLPRSTRNHWVPGPATLAHRLWLSTSTAYEAANDALCVDEAIAGRLRDSSRSLEAWAVRETASGTLSTTAVPTPNATNPGLTTPQR